jgi:hypothetical protein
MKIANRKAKDDRESGLNALEAYANMGVTPEDWKRFRLKYPEFFPKNLSEWAGVWLSGGCDRGGGRSAARYWNSAERQLRDEGRRSLQAVSRGGRKEATGTSGCQPLPLRKLKNWRN